MNKRIFFLFVLFVFLFNVCFFSATWVKTEEDSALFISDVINVEDGYLFLGNRDGKILLFKLSEDGSLIKSNAISLENNSYGAYILRTADGNYIIEGDTLNQQGNRDLLFLKIDGSGKVFWAKTCDSGGLDTLLEKPIATSDNGFFITYFGSDLQGVIKCDENGEKQWTKLYNWRSGNYSYKSICEIASGGYLMALIGGGDYSCSLVVKINDSGEVLWQKKLTSGGQFWISDMIKEGSDILVASRVQDVNLNNCCAILKFDDGLNCLMKKGFTNNLYYSGLPVLTKTADGFIAGNSLLLSKESEDWDNWLIKLDNNLNLVSEKRFNFAQNSEWIDKVIDDGEKGYFVLGCWEVAQYNYQPFLIKLNNLMSLDTPCEIEREISSYNADFNLTISDAQPVADDNLEFFVQDISVQWGDGPDILLKDLCTGCPDIVISPSLLPDGKSGESYSASLSASGGSAPYQFSIISGKLPEGLSLSEDGIISGTPQEGGDYSFIVSVVDASYCKGEKEYTLHIEVVPPSISSVSKLSDPFRLKILGSNFHSDINIFIGDDSVPWTNLKYKNSSEIVLKKGKSLKDKFPKGVPVKIKIVNGDGGETNFTYIR